MVTKIEEYIKKRRESNDCISRADAIDAVRKIFMDYENDEIGAIEPNMSNIVCALEGLKTKVPTNN